MAWWRGDDRSHANAKLLAVDLDGTGLYFRGVSWCAQHETDGFLPKVAVPTLAPGWTPKRLAVLVGKLVEQRLWAECDGGYLIPDFLDFNPSKETLDKKRQREQDRRSAGRDSRYSSNGTHVRDGSVPARCGQPDGSVPGPGPARPVPLTTTSSAAAPPRSLTVVRHDPAADVVDAALQAIARRKLERREAELGPVGQRGRWIRGTIEGLRVEWADRIASAPAGLLVDGMVEWLDPAPQRPVARTAGEKSLQAILNTRGVIGGVGA